MKPSSQSISFRNVVAAMSGSYDAPLWVVVVSFLGGMLSDQFKQWTGGKVLFGISLSWIMLIGLLLFLVGFYLFSRRGRRPVIEMREQAPVGKAGLVLLVSKINLHNNMDQEAFKTYLQRVKDSSPEDLGAHDLTRLFDSNLAPACKALEFHYRQGKLRDCWLIATRDTQTENGSKDVPPVLEKWFRTLHPSHHVRFHHGSAYCVDPRDYVGLWHLIDRLFRKAPYKTESIIADITSGTKLMSLGAALACLHEKRTMQYMTAGRDWRREPLPSGEIVPVLVDIDPHLQWAGLLEGGK